MVERPERMVTPKQGVPVWAHEAGLVLRDLASTYNATITSVDLAELVQQRSRLRTKSAVRTWLPGVLAIVARACHQGELPALTSLVVQKSDGRVGDAYDLVLRASELPLFSDPMDRERHAAQARLDCYRRFCPTVPQDAAPTLPEPGRRPARVQTPRAAAPSAVKAKVCPTCFIQLPLDGAPCPNCE